MLFPVEITIVRIWEVFAIWNGGFSHYSGLITGLLLLYMLCWRKARIIPGFLDIAAPSVMIAQSLGRALTKKKLMVTMRTSDYLPGFIRDQMYIEGSYDRDFPL